MRLIDADILIKNLSYLYTKNHIPVDMRAKEILTTIMEQPTAYDIDKVVEEIRRSSGNGYRDVDGDYVPPMIKTKSAIEIVKQGGDTNDVCKWRLCDEELNIYNIRCRNPHILFKGTPKENNYKFCPYCGKKIKVVE